MTYEELGIENDMPYGWISEELWHEKVWSLWHNMHDRCKNPNNPSYSYYKDSKILDAYSKLSNYKDFIMNEPRFEEFKATCHEITWSVDKDIKKKGNKNYYPEFMTLCTKSENSQDCCSRNGSPNKGNFKSVIALSKDNLILIKSINEAKNFGFKHQGIYRSMRNKRPYNGYRWYYINYKHNKRYRKVVK